MHSLVERILCLSPMVGEAHALLIGLKLAATSGFHSIVCEMSCVVFFQAFQHFLSFYPWDIAATLVAIKVFNSCIASISFSWVSRSTTLIADAVAKLCLKGTLPSYWCCYDMNDLTALL